MKSYLSIWFVVSKDHNPSNRLQKIKLKHHVTFKVIAHQSLYFGTFCCKNLIFMWCHSYDQNMETRHTRWKSQVKTKSWLKRGWRSCIGDGSGCNSCRNEQFAIHNSVGCDHNCDVIAQEVFRMTYPTLRGTKSSLTTGN